MNKKKIIKKIKIIKKMMMIMIITIMLENEKYLN